MVWLLRKFRKTWAWIASGFSSSYRIIVVEELPDQLKSKMLYVAGENEYLWFAAMACPCGCGEVLQMSLMPEQRPRWVVTKHDNGTASLHPSVWRKVGCKSHFWLKRGKIIWCKE